MPELPDVEVFKRYLDSTSVGQRIETVKVRSDKVLEGTTEKKLGETLKGKMFAGSTRHGKNLFVELDSGKCLRLHFGMTGFLHYFNDANEEHKHSRVVFVFENGGGLSFVCQRQLGRVFLVSSAERWIEENNLGPDALEVGLSGFKERLAGRKGSVKSALMNQELIAGIGNIYADEVLFQARVRPDKNTALLDDKALQRIHRKTGEVLKAAIKAGADPEKFPHSFIIPQRSEGAPCPACGSKIKMKKINQRSSYFCPSCQK